MLGPRGYQRVRVIKLPSREVYEATQWDAMNHDGDSMHYAIEMFPFERIEYRNEEGDDKFDLATVQGAVRYRFANPMLEVVVEDAGYAR
jgi:hypothetical protein